MTGVFFSSEMTEGLKKIKSLLDQIGLGKLWIKADYMDVRYLQYYQAKIHLVIKNVFKFK